MIEGKGAHLLGTLGVGRNNNLNLIRMILAVSVLVSHAVPLSEGRSAVEPLQQVLHFSLGSLAVYGFFGISGFLVTQSLLVRQNLASYAVARGLRIFPGLIVVLLLTVLVLGPVATDLPLSDYATRMSTWSYFPANISLLRLQYALPGVFRTNAYPDAINGSLWTLSFEVGCYLMLAFVWRIGAFRNSYRLGWTALGVALCYVALAVVSRRISLPTKVGEFALLSECFVMGTMFYVLRDRVPLNRPLAALLLAGAVVADFYFSSLIVFFAAYIYALLTFGYLGAKPLDRYNALGDYSYGTYIYAFPVAQLLAWLWPGISLLHLALASFLVTLPLAVLSWHLVEKPALFWKRRVSSPERGDISQQAG
jgi:peptidoglycan/LPS O-acetylase OafA/YrhL